MARVAVWLTNYASERHLPRAIESVLGQTFKDFTLYVFDNHSPAEAPAIIAGYAERDSRVVPVAIPEGLAGIPLMDFAWRFLNDKGQDYSITLGGHDFWNQPEFLQILVERMDGELQARGPEGVSILYCDTMQVNADSDTNAVGRYQNIIQLGQIPRFLLPQVCITTVDSPQLFGLWNERIRRKLPIRYQCGGWDHLIVMEASLHGNIMWEPRAQLIMRCPPSDDGPDKYGKRHFSPENLKRGQQDFIDQLEWCVHCVKLANPGDDEQSQTRRMMLIASMITTYMVLRGSNLAQIPDAFPQFVQNPLVIEAMKGAHHTMRFVESLIRTCKPSQY